MASSLPLLLLLLLPPLLLLPLPVTLEEEAWAAARMPLSRRPPAPPGPRQEQLPGPAGRRRPRADGPVPAGTVRHRSPEGAPRASQGTRPPEGPGEGKEPQGETNQPQLAGPGPPGKSGAGRPCRSWVVKMSLLGVLGLLVVLGNGLVIAVVASSVSGWSRSSRLVLLSLAAADAGQALLVVPLNLYRGLVGGPAAGEGAAGGEAAYCRGVAFVNCSVFGASLYSLAGVSLERYVAVFFPLRYGQLLSPRRVALLIAAAWLLPALLLLPLALPAPWAVLRVRFSAAALLCEPDYGSNGAYALSVAGLIFCPAAATITFANLRLWLAARSQLRRGGGGPTLPGTEAGPRRPCLLQLDAAARVLLPVVCAFYVCWAPCIGTILYNAVTQERVHEWAEFVALWLPVCSGLLNCFVYFWVNRNFRHKFQTIGRRLCWPCWPSRPELRPQPLQAVGAAVERGLPFPSSSGMSSSSLDHPLVQEGQ